MADGKRYYWLKLKRDFFKRHDIQIIEAMPNGKDYVLFYLKLLVESVDHEGSLRFSDTIPYNEQMLSTITNTNVDIVHRAMEIFRSLNLVEILDDQTIFMEETEKMVGSESWSTERVRRFRDKEQKALPCNTDVTGCNDKVTSRNEEIEKELEIDKENRDKPPIPPKRGEDMPKRSSYESRFEAFWDTYPRKAGKGAAEKAFLKYKPDDALLERMISAVEAQKVTEQWQRDGGQYIPYPATWLNQKRWEDEAEPPQKQGNQLSDDLAAFEQSGVFDQFDRR